MSDGAEFGFAGLDAVPISKDKIVEEFKFKRESTKDRYFKELCGFFVQRIQRDQIKNDNFQELHDILNVAKADETTQKSKLNLFLKSQAKKIIGPEIEIPNPSEFDFLFPDIRDKYTNLYRAAGETTNAMSVFDSAIKCQTTAGQIQIALTKLAEIRDKLAKEAAESLAAAERHAAEAATAAERFAAEAAAAETSSAPTEAARAEAAAAAAAAAASTAREKLSKAITVALAAKKAKKAAFAAASAALTTKKENLFLLQSASSWSGGLGSLDAVKGLQLNTRSIAGGMSLALRSREAAPFSKPQSPKTKRHRPRSSSHKSSKRALSPKKNARRS